MFRPTKSARYSLSHPLSEPVSSHRQSGGHRYRQASEGLHACEVANNKTDGTRHYVLRDTGREYFGGIRVD